MYANTEYTIEASSKLHQKHYEKKENLPFWLPVEKGGGRVNVNNL